MAKDVFSREYWLEVRERIIHNENPGIKECHNWASDASFAVSQDTGINFSREVCTRSLVLARMKLGEHFWLEARYRGRIFIADGTAGQLDERFPLGYYGYLEDTPWPLREVYLQPDF